MTLGDTKRRRWNGRIRIVDKMREGVKQREREREREREIEIDRDR